MWNHTVAKALLAACFAWSGWTSLGERPVHPADGEIAAAEPRQGEPSSGVAVQIGRWTLKPRAGYEITARILGHERYRFDELADLIPEDLVLGSARAKVLALHQEKHFRHLWLSPRKVN